MVSVATKTIRGVLSSRATGGFINKPGCFLDRSQGDSSSARCRKRFQPFRRPWVSRSRTLRTTAAACITYIENGILTSTNRSPQKNQGSQIAEQRLFENGAQHVLTESSYYADHHYCPISWRAESGRSSIGNSKCAGAQATHRPESQLLYLPCY